MVDLLQLTAMPTQEPLLGKPPLIAKPWQRRWTRAAANCSLCLTCMSCQGKLTHPILSSLHLSTST